MTRYFLDIRFNGTAYSGWQTQPNGVTVQGQVEAALEKILRRPVQTYGAGRTDAGVHALHMPTQFEHEGELHPAFFKSINAVLPHDISVMRIWRTVDPELHTRFHAVSRAYRYQLTFNKDPHLQNQAYWYKEPIDVQAMFDAAGILKEFNSFESFCKSNADNTTFLCEIFDSRFEWEGEVLVYHVRANRFLRGMVRAIVGTMLMIGRGKLDQEGLRDLLQKKDRRLAGPSVVPHGLYLSEVLYPEGALELYHAGHGRGRA